jgi:hypothetical protein
MYVKVYGTIRVFNKEKAIVGTHIKKIDRFDDVTNHLLQVFVAHAIRKKGVLTNRDLHGQAVIAGQNPRASGASYFGGSGSMTSQGGFAVSGITASGDHKQIVLSVMREISKSNKFIHKSDIYAHVQQQMKQSDFNQALTTLCDNGAIYSTYDNDIYSITSD